MGPRRLKHQRRHQTGQLRCPLQRQPGITPGEKPGAECIADTGWILLVGLGDHVDVYERPVAPNDIHAVLTQGRDAQLDLIHHLDLRPPGLLQQQIPFVVVGEQICRAIDELADLLAGQSGQLLARVGSESQAE